MRVLVLGASGMAGHLVGTYLRENGFEVDTLSASHQLDDKTFLVNVTDGAKLKAVLDAHHYDAVINCIGLLVKQSEDRPDLAVYLNSYLPRYLEDYYKGTQTKVLHISTDEVFSFDQPPYREDSAYDGQTIYGRSKALGELNNAKDLTFRMSIIGPDWRAGGSGLFNWFYAQHGEIAGYANVIWNGVTTLELAKAMAAAIKWDLSGIYHLVPSKSIAKFELLKLLNTVFGRSDIEIKPVKVNPVDKTLLNTRRDFNYKVPDYPTMVKDMKNWVDKHRELYKHYGKK